MVLLSLFACSHIRTITIEDSARTTVAKGTLLETLLGDLGFADFVSMDLTDRSELKNQGVEPGDIQESHLVQFELEALQPEGADLSFLDSMSVSVEAPSVDKALLASADAFPEGQPKVVFTLTDLDLTPYIVSESMTFTTDVSAHRPEEDTVVVARFAVDVTATVQGIRNQLKEDSGG